MQPAAPHRPVGRTRLAQTANRGSLAAGPSNHRQTGSRAESRDIGPAPKSNLDWTQPNTRASKHTDRLRRSNCLEPKKCRPTAVACLDLRSELPAVQANRSAPRSELKSKSPAPIEIPL